MRIMSACVLGGADRDPSSLVCCERAGGEPGSSPSNHTLAAAAAPGVSAMGPEGQSCGAAAGTSFLGGGEEQEQPRRWKARLLRRLRAPRSRVPRAALVSAELVAAEFRVPTLLRLPRGTVLLGNRSNHLSRSQTLACPMSISRTNFCRRTAAALSTHPPKSSMGGRTRARR